MGLPSNVLQMFGFVWILKLKTKTKGKAQSSGAVEFRVTERAEIEER